MRYFNYLDNLHELNEGFVICEKIFEDISSIDLSFFDEKERNTIVELYRRAIELRKKMGDSSYYWDRAINADLLKPENVEYCMKNGRYPENASSKGEALNKIFRNFFAIEDRLQVYVGKMWQKIATPFREIRNGEPFVLCGHSGYGYVNLPGTRYHNKHSNDTNFSCSIFTEQSMNYFNSPLIMLFDINPDSYIASAPFDASTRKVDTHKSIKTLKETENGIISAGYSYNMDVKRAVTKSSNPLQLIKTINSQDKEPLTGKGIINETILDKEKAKPTGLVLFSSGCDLLLAEYMNALRMKYDYNLDMKVINRALYRKKMGLPPYREQDLVELEKSMAFYKKEFLSNEFSYDDVISIIDSYIENVMDKLELEPEIYNRLLLYFEKLKKMKKESQLS